MRPDTILELEGPWRQQCGENQKGQIWKLVNRRQKGKVKTTLQMLGHACRQQETPCPRHRWSMWLGAAATARGGGWLALPGEMGTGIKRYQVRPASSKKGNPWKDSIRLANSHGQHGGWTQGERCWYLCLPPVRVFTVMRCSGAWSHCL